MKFLRMLILGLVACSPVAALAEARSVATVDAEITTNATLIKTNEAAIRAWDSPEKLAVLGDAQLNAWAAERNAATARLAKIDGRWGERYYEDPQTRAWCEEGGKLDLQVEELRKTPGNDEAIQKLSNERQNISGQLSLSRPRLEPDMEPMSRLCINRNIEIFTRLSLLLRQHSEGKALMTSYDQALVRRETLDAEWLKIQGLTRALPYLRSQPTLEVAKGSTLHPLTRFAYSKNDFDFQKELAERWGYCLSIPGYFGDVTLENCKSPATLEGRLVALVKSNPKRYKLQVVANRGWPENPPQETWCRDAAGKVLSAQAKSFDGTLWSPGMDSVISPEAPDAVWQECGRMRAEPIAGLRKICPISMVLSGGEYGLGISGFAGPAWAQDPKVQKARGKKSWFDYISTQKGRESKIIADALRKAVPDRELFIYYTLSGMGQANRWWAWQDWGYDPGLMKGASDLASDEFYLSHFNAGFTCTAEQLPQTCDILTAALNSRGRDIAVGLPLAYSWIWASTNKEYDRPRWRGLLKMLYTTGLVGTNIGNYHMVTDDEFAQPFPVDKPPFWLDEITAAARVHALFSHVEPFLRQGELLPGPEMHVYSKEQPAYEFPTGDRDARVVARKLNKKAEWLITAWAGGGADRPLTVKIPGLGKVTLQARSIGTVYTASERAGKPVLVQLPQDDPLSKP